MRAIYTVVGFVGVIAAAAGCASELGLGETDDGDEDVGTATSAQIDPGVRGYSIKQLGIQVSYAWAGTVGPGPVEYWVSKPGYSPGAARTYDGASMSCATFKRTVCGASWAGSTYYKATYTQQTLNCALPPGPCTPLPGAVAFLGAGSYRTDDAAGTPFAYTYVSGSCEYWAMNHLISTGWSSQVPIAPGYSSHTDFITQMCALGSPPSTYFEAQYTQLAGCSAITC